MLTSFPLNGFVRITDPERARRFYEQVLGWEVKDIENVVSVLRKRGVVFEKYEGTEQDDHRIWKSPAGKVAWFKDPDGNILSVSEH